MTKKILLVVAILAAIVAGALTWRATRAWREGGSAAHRQIWYCPMHPDYTAGKAGECPICHMALVEKKDEASDLQASGTGAGVRMCVLHNCTMTNCPMEMTLKPGERVDCPICGTYVEGRSEAGSALYYRHPHKPEITSPTPAKDEMGMDFIPVYAQAGAGAQPLGSGAQPLGSGVKVSAAAGRLIGLKTAAVGKRRLTLTVRAAGRVAYDPDLYNALNELREAALARDRVKDSPLVEARERAEALLQASRLRLRQMGLSETQADRAQKETEAPTNLLLGGDTVWVYAQIYESEVGLVKAGQAVALTSPAFPGRSFVGMVRALDPILDPQTRSLKVRIEVPDPRHELKLEMYAEAAIKVDLGVKPALPEDALLDTGARRLAFVDLGGGRMEPREVSVGARADSYYELLSGVALGEKVVTSANFLIDSESRLKSALQKAEAPKESAR